MSTYLLGKVGDQKLETVLLSLSCIAKLCPAAFKDSASIVIDFVSGSLLRRRKGGNAYEASCKVAGVKLLQKYAQKLSVKERDDCIQLKGIIKTLVGLVSDSDSVESDEKTASLVREAAAVAVLKVARKANALISNVAFLMICYTAKVRRM